MMQWWGCGGDGSDEDVTVRSSQYDHHQSTVMTVQPSQYDQHSTIITVLSQWPRLATSQCTRCHCTYSLYSSLYSLLYLSLYLSLYSSLYYCAQHCCTTHCLYSIRTTHTSLYCCHHCTHCHLQVVYDYRMSCHLQVVYDTHSNYLFVIPCDYIHECQLYSWWGVDISVTNDRHLFATTIVSCIRGGSVAYLYRSLDHLYRSVDHLYRLVDISPVVSEPSLQVSTLSLQVSEPSLQVIRPSLQTSRPSLQFGRPSLQGHYIISTVQ
jgi:hypothetical protein